MGKSTVKTNVFQKYTRVYSVTLGNRADDCFAFVGFKNNRYDDARPIGAFRAIVCDKANTRFSDELMDEISMRFSISNTLHKGNNLSIGNTKEMLTRKLKKLIPPKTRRLKQQHPQPLCLSHLHPN